LACPCLFKNSSHTGTILLRNSACNMPLLSHTHIYTVHIFIYVLNIIVPM
jgi:hypothetical protein